MYEIKKDVPVPNGRSGPKLSKFPLKTMEVGDSFLIPYVKRTVRGKSINTPEAGLNIKAANTDNPGKKFKKSKSPNGDGVYIHRVQ